MSEALRRVFSDADLKTVAETSECTWCRRPIYTAFVGAPWRHEGTGNQECRFFAAPTLIEPSQTIKPSEAK